MNATPTKIILLKIVFSSIFLLSSISSYSQLTGWLYKNYIHIQENSGNTKTNYQVLFTLNTQTLIAQGKMKARGEDIRVASNCDGSGLLNFWIEDTGVDTINTANTNIWVKVPSIPASGLITIYLFYGKSNAVTSSNFTNTFPRSKIVSLPQEIEPKDTTSWNYDWIEIKNGSTVTLAPDHLGTLTIQARKIIISGTLNGNGSGAKGGTTGVGSSPSGTNGGGGTSSSPDVQSGGGGAGHGNVGGKGGGSSAFSGKGGLAYGNSNDTLIEIGSGGGTTPLGANSVGGNGGAAFKLKASIINISGNISVDGTDGIGPEFGSGGGSGGSIVMLAKTITHTGSLSANGGKGGDKVGSGNGLGGGGGAGGRIKVFYETTFANTGTLNVNGGSGGAGGTPAAQAGGNGSNYNAASFISGEPTVSITQDVGPRVSINISSGNNPSCSDNSITFTATPINGGTLPSYQWRKNGTAISGENASTYTSSDFNDGDIISCRMISNMSCINPDSALSNTITLTINPSPIAPTISGTTTVCNGDSVILTSSTSTGNQWYLNGNPVNDENGDKYKFLPLNNDVVYVINTNSSGCSTQSASKTITVNTTPEKAVISGNNATCSGDSLTLTSSADINNQWFLNNQIVNGATNKKFSFVPLNRDSIYVKVSNTSGCFTISEKFKITVNDKPEKPIISGINAVCMNDSLTLSSSATSDNQWYLNGLAVTGATNSTYRFKPTDGDQVSVTVKNSLNCTNTSNPFPITVLSTVVPSISISADMNPVCIGHPVTFTASPANEGSSPIYEWKINSTTVSNNSSFSTTSLNDNDTITCTLTSSNSCANPSTVTSQKLTIKVNPILIPSLSISASDNSICTGKTVVFSTQTTNEGQNPIFKWILNEKIISNATNSVYSTDSLKNNDKIRCMMISSAPCAEPDTIASTDIIMTVTDVAHADFQAPDTAKVNSAVSFVNLSTSSSLWDWNFGDGNNSSSENPQHTFQNAGTYTVKLISKNNFCSDSITHPIVIVPDIGINQPTTDNSILVSPNPNQGNFLLELGKEIKTIWITITDINGKELYKKQIEESIQVDISNVPPGLYFLQASTDKNIFRQCLIIF